MSMGPLDLYEIGEAVSEALPEPEDEVCMIDADQWHWSKYQPIQEPQPLGERVLSELQRRGWSLVRSEGERDG